MDDKELDKDNPMRGRPAACTSIHGDGKGNIVVGTVCNEIYEIEAADFDGTGDASPMCIMQVGEEPLTRLAASMRGTLPPCFLHALLYNLPVDAT